MSTCAKCGKKFGRFSEKWNTEQAYYDLPLNERYPDNPYKGKYLCWECYKETYKNAPALPVKKSANDKSTVTDNSTKGIEMLFRGIVCIVFVIAFFVSIARIMLLPSAVWNFVGFGQGLGIAFALLVGFCVILLSFWVWADGEELKSLRETVNLLKLKVDELNSKKQASDPEN